MFANPVGKPTRRRNQRAGVKPTEKQDHRSKEVFAALTLFIKRRQDLIRQQDIPDIGL
jgi:hypothetical protein